MAACTAWSAWARPHPASVVEHLPRVPTRGLQLVSLLGGLPRRNPAHPFEVIDRLAEKTGAEAHLLPVPMFSCEAADRDVLRRQTGVAEALRLTAQASLLLMGIGEADATAFLRRPARCRTPTCWRRVPPARWPRCSATSSTRRDAASTPRCMRASPACRCPNSDRRSQPSRRARSSRWPAGRAKAACIDAVLQSRLLTGLITDELTARQLVASRP